MNFKLSVLNFKFLICFVLCPLSFVLLFPQTHAREYINPSAPAVKIPPYEGERYEALVPDTLDIAERAKLARHGLTSPLDPDDGYSLYWLVNYTPSPPSMLKEDYNNIQAKFMEALPLLRIASGSALNSHVDQAWMDGLMKSIGEDGLIYAQKINGQFHSLGG